MINVQSLEFAAVADISFFSMEEHATKLEAQGYQFGTVEITIGCETRRVPCMVCDGLIETYGWMTGITGRYATGTKAWPCTILQRKTFDGKIVEIVRFGRDDRCGQRKVSISFPVKAALSITQL